MNSVSYSKEIPLYGEYDICVLGGGPAGVCAAVSAAREHEIAAGGEVFNDRARFRIADDRAGRHADRKAFAVTSGAALAAAVRAV